MFTGLIEATGSVGAMESRGSATLLRVETPLAAELSVGDSIAVDGVCLTVTKAAPATFEATVSPETLRVTSLGHYREGTSINLERPLKADARLGGHFVLGHVDGLGTIRALDRDGECYWLEVVLPVPLMAYVIPKGSIALNGISLTVAGLDRNIIRVQIVPHTWTHTSLQSARPGDTINVETDVIGKYVARLLGERVAAGEWPGLEALTK